jgi:asparagine synthase (glutamine-hydrolysing)
MSAQFGIWNFDGGPPLTEDIDKAVSWLIPYGPDGESSYSKGGVSIVYRAFHTTKEARGEIQPHRSRSGAVTTWDGRLDNRTELRQQLRSNVEGGCPDVLIVAAAYEQWGVACFARFIGDWALSIWNPNEQSLLLAKDPIGTRPLYYSIRDAGVTWSSVLEPLVLCAAQPVKLNEEYIAGWLASFPVPPLTPYVGIQAVPPSCFVHVAGATHVIHKFWDFDPDRKITHKTDEEYEDHFRSAFRDAVQCRLRSDTPILAELSGGMDSSAIVCMADTIIRNGEADAPRLDTVSYYNDDEPNWNERPYFTKVELQRGRTGSHIRVDGEKMFALLAPAVSLCATPARLADAGPTEGLLAACANERGSRVLLSGIGGDEVTGGVPTAIPEMADLLAEFRLGKLWKQLGIWAISQRRPWFQIFFQTAKEFLPRGILGSPGQGQFATWLDPRFSRTNQHALAGHPVRLKMFESRPSFQDNLHTLDGLRGQLACFSSLSCTLHEKRYPFLDRNFLEFMYAIPRAQIVRPGQRRSLMRRALASIVPQDILDRRRKAFVARAPMVAIAKNAEALLVMSANMASESLGVVDSQRFTDVLHDACRGLEVAPVPIMRTVQLELWIKHLASSGLINNLPHSGQKQESGAEHTVLAQFTTNEPRKEVRT